MILRTVLSLHPEIGVIDFDVSSSHNFGLGIALCNELYKLLVDVSIGLNSLCGKIRGIILIQFEIVYLHLGRVFTNSLFLTRRCSNFNED